MLTRSKSKKLRNFKQAKNSEVKMASNYDVNGSNEREFEVNNQMGETEIFEEITNNGAVPVSSEARGRAEENVILSLIHI